MGVVTGRQPRIRAQIGNLNCVVLLDSGSSLSILSERHFQQLNLGGQDFKLFDTELTCVIASSHNLEIMGEVRATLRTNNFSSPWRFLVGKKLKGEPILGVDFISRSNLVLDLGKSSVIFVLQQECRFLSVRVLKVCRYCIIFASIISYLQCGVVNSPLGRKRK